MICYRSQKQQTLEGFETPFQTALDATNRWVKLSQCIPWDELAEGYYKGLSSRHGRPCKDARLVIAAVIIKHKLCLSDEETVQQLQENPYLQYFAGLPGYTTDAPFVPSLFVEIRKRMGQEVFERFHKAIVDAEEAQKGKPKSIKEPSDGSNRDNNPPGGDANKGSGNMKCCPGEEQHFIRSERVNGYIAFGLSAIATIAKALVDEHCGPEMDWQGLD